MNKKDFTSLGVDAVFTKFIETEKSIKSRRMISSFNEHFMDEINENSAYILGLIYADGCVYKSHKFDKYPNAMAISLCADDIELLEKIKKFIGSNRKFNICNKGRLAQLCVHNRYFVSRLASLGVVPRKSTMDSHIPVLPAQYMSDFIRGFFDGDGCISYGAYKGKRYVGEKSFINAATFCGNYIFLKELKDVMNDFGISFGSLVKQRNIFSLSVRSFASIKLLYNFMYKSNTLLFMKRKRDKFEKLLSWEGLGVQEKIDLFNLQRAA